MIAATTPSIFENPAAANPALAEVFARATGFERTRGLADEAAQSAAILQRIHAGRQEKPALLGGFAADWPALHRWNREYLLTRWGDRRVGALMDLAPHGVPFLKAETDMRRRLTLRDFWETMETAGRCYIDQQTLGSLPGLAEDLRVTDLLGARPPLELNVWLGRGTKSGLHFDPTENFVVMIRGYKLVTLASVDEATRLYPFPGLIMKSQVDVEHPDFARFPRARQVEMQVARLAPGDVLYLPAGWWHHVSSATDEPHVSINCAFGRELSSWFLATRLLRLGPRHVARLLQDFFIYGVLGRPCSGRVHTVPNGLQLYRQLRAGWQRAVVPWQR